VHGLVCLRLLSDGFEFTVHLAQHTVAAARDHDGIIAKRALNALLCSELSSKSERRDLRAAAGISKAFAHTTGNTAQLETGAQQTHDAAAYVIKASENAGIPVPQGLCLLDNHSCSWLSSHYLRHNESLLNKRQRNNTQLKEHTPRLN